jgi:hypothetical protein
MVSAGSGISLAETKSVTTPPRAAEVSLSRHAMRIVVSAMAVPPFVVRVQSLLMPVAVIAGIAAPRDRTGIMAPTMVIDAGAHIVRKA